MGIYRDTVCSNNDTIEEVLRPNGCIAIAVAPELFDKSNALLFLHSTDYYLTEPNSLGLKTLHPFHENYSWYYDNEEDSTKKKTAKGYSYHNGPVNFFFILYISFVYFLININ